MRSRLLVLSVDRVARKIPGVRRIPALQLIAAGEVALIAAHHLRRLTPAERRRLVALVHTGRLRRNRLTDAEQHELRQLLDKLETRRFVGEAVRRLSPLPLPRRLVGGRDRRGPAPRR